MKKRGLRKYVQPLIEEIGKKMLINFRAFPLL
jgi:hypothetical protein